MRHLALLEAPQPSLTGMSLTLFGSPPLIQLLSMVYDGAEFM